MVAIYNTYVYILAKLETTRADIRQGDATCSRVWEARQEPPEKVAQESGVSTPPQLTRPS